MKYCSNRCKAFALVAPSTQNTSKLKMSTLNRVAFDLGSNRYRGKRQVALAPTDALGNREGAPSNRAPPRNF